jgi:hypothetical protein
MLRFLLGIAAGAAAAYAYLSNEREGPRRRTELRRWLDRVPGISGAGRAEGGGAAPPAASGPAEDTADLARAVAAHRTAGTWDSDDAALAQKVRSEALGSTAASGAGIVVNAERGVVVLRGVVESAAAGAALEAAARRVDGVRDVENRLRPAGETAPEAEAR